MNPQKGTTLGPLGSHAKHTTGFRLSLDGSLGALGGRNKRG